MFSTVEVRWFFQGKCTDEVSDWFSTVVGTVESPEIRTDKYLWLPGMTSLGVKTRGQNLEIKLRIGEYGAVKLGPAAGGQLEQWRKWSFGLDHAPGEMKLARVNDSNWIPIRKQRFLRRYKIKNDQEVIAISLGSLPAAGCEVELTAIELLDQSWWTFAFESFGEESTLVDSLTLLSATILSFGSPPRLPEARSFGYPQWLQRNVNWS